MKQTSHPFSTDHFLHGGDYNPDQWLDRPDILEKDLEYFEKAGINCVSLGIFFLGNAGTGGRPLPV